MNTLLLVWRWCCLCGRARLLLLLLPGFLLQVCQLLQLLRRKNRFDLRRSVLANLICLGNLLFLGHRSVVAQGFHLPIFILKDRLQLGLLFIRQVQRIVVRGLRLRLRVPRGCL